MALTIPSVPSDYIPGNHFPEIVYKEAIAAQNQLSRDRSISKRPPVKGITIDGPTTPDIDDAIWMTELPNGDIQIDVSISDVTYIVKPGSKLDAEALARVETAYRGGHAAAPMLPRPLSEDALSLRNSFLRPTMTVSIVLGSDLEVKEITHQRTRLLSEKRLTYDAVDTYLAEDEQPTRLPSLKAMELLAKRLMTKRTATTVLNNNDDASDPLEDALAMPLEHESTGRKAGPLIVQEFMILANRATAQKLAEAQAPTLYRVRPKSGYQKARYSHEPDEHSDLGLDAYVHFTSPIRRYADTVAHRAVAAALLNEDESTLNQDDLEKLAVYLNRRIEGVENRRSASYASPEHHAKRAQGRLQRFTTYEFERMREDHFDELMLYCAENAVSTDAFFEALRTKISSGIIGEKKLLILLFNVKSKDARWSELTRDAVKRLEHTPFLATTLIAKAVESGSISECSYHEDAKGTQFTCFVRATVDTQVTTSRTHGVGSKKQDAKNQASFLWLSDYVNGQLVQAPVELEQTVAPNLEATNAAMQPEPQRPSFDVLAGYLGRMRAEKPEVVTEEIKHLGKNSIWKVTVTVTLPDGNKYIAVETHSSSKVAKQKAAAAILKNMTMPD